MRRETAIEATLIIFFLLIVTAIIAASGADIKISSYFSFGGKWSMTNLHPWRALYLLDRYPAIFITASSIVIAAYSYKNLSMKIWRKRALFLLFALIIGPALIVNAGFKDNWGRPRPREIREFGGKKEFLQPWQYGGRRNGRSFPSGHGSAAFFMMTPYFIYRRNNRKVAIGWLAGGLVFGVMMSAARIIQGAHFLSDNLWSFGIIYLTALFLADFMKLDVQELTTKGDLDACTQHNQ